MENIPPLALFPTERIVFLFRHFHISHVDVKCFETRKTVAEMGWAVKHHRFPTLQNSLSKSGLQDSNPNIAAEVCRMVEWSILTSENNRVYL